MCIVVLVFFFFNFYFTDLGQNQLYCPNTVVLCPLCLFLPFELQLDSMCSMFCFAQDGKRGLFKAMIDGLGIFSTILSPIRGFRLPR